MRLEFVGKRARLFVGRRQLDCVAIWNAAQFVIVGADTDDVAIRWTARFYFVLKIMISNDYQN